MDASEILIIVKEIFDESEPIELSSILLKNLRSLEIHQTDDFHYECRIDLSFNRT